MRAFALTCCTALLALAEAAAEEYSWQLSAGAERLEVGDPIETDRYTLDATYYFRGVDDGVGPYALAPFLNRSSRLGLAAHREEQTTRLVVTSPTIGPIDLTTSVETDGYSVAGRHVWRDSGWYAGGGYHDAGADLPSSTIAVSSLDLEAYSVHFGKYVARTTTVDLTWDSAESRNEIRILSCTFFCPPFVGSEVDTENASLGALHVGNLGGLAYSVGGRVASRRADARPLATPAPMPTLPTTLPPFAVVGGITAVPVPIPSSTPMNPTVIGRFHTYAVSGELFPTTRLGVRINYERWDGDPLRDDAYELAATWFATRQVALHASLGRTKRSSALIGAADEDSAALRVIGRF